MYAQTLPKVEYALNPLGESLVTPPMHLYDWNNTNMPVIKASRKRYKKVTAL